MNRKWYSLSVFLFLSSFFAVLLLWGLQKPAIEKTVVKKHRSDAFSALEFLTQARAYPYPDIPSEGFYSEYKREQSRMYKGGANSLVPPWKPIGPLNVPGRMIALAVNPLNPKTLYAGSASGGLWRTYNSTTGSGWHRIKTGFPVSGVMAIAIDPADTNTIYIGTGEVYGYKTSIGGYIVRVTRGSYGIGILKTTDAGRTWSKSLDWTANQQRGIQKLCINPRKSSVIYAGTSEGTYKTVDGGKNWNKIHNSFMVQDIIVHPSDTNKVLISCGNLGSQGAGVFQSGNSGASWSSVSGLPSFSGKTLFDYFKQDPNLVIASVAHSENGLGLYLSVDFGNTWNRVHNQDVQSYQGFFSHWAAIHPDDFTRIIHAGVNIYYSNNQGQTLTQVSGSGVPHVDHHAFAHHPSSPDIIFIACDGGVYRSANFGRTYQSIGNGLQTAQFYNGFANSSLDSLLAIGGLQDNNCVMYKGTGNWTLKGGGDGCCCAINPENDNKIFISSQYNNISRSLNKGVSFTSATVGMIESSQAAFVSPFAISQSNPSIMYSGRKRVYKSFDEGASWTPTNLGNLLDVNAVLSLAIYANDENIVYCATGPVSGRGKVFRTTNGGSFWTNLTGDLPDRYPLDIAIDPNDHLTVYIAFGGYFTDHIYKTTNGGISWLSASAGLPDIPTMSIAIDPDNTNHIYAGNDYGVYFSSNGGAQWTPFSEGLDDCVVAMDLVISKTNKVLRLASHGSGAYERPLVSSGPVSIKNAGDNKVPQLFVLKQNYPNPFNPTTRIEYEIMRECTAELSIYDAAGRKVAELFRGKRSPGVYSETVSAGKLGLSSGIYIYSLSAGEIKLSRKMVFLK